PDGLAMSSRNSYLQVQDRAAATVLYKALQAGQATFMANSPDGPQAVRQAMIDVIAREPLAKLDYAEIRDPGSFLPLEILQAPALLLLAVSISTTRLIDNFALIADGTWNTGIFLTQEHF